MKTLASVFIFLSLLSACEQTTPAMGHPMGMEAGEMNEGMEHNEAGERH